ncbi:hypothetical protein ANTQUA_LOCUS10210 [Anthophora quadrimaculata]
MAMTRGQWCVDINTTIRSPDTPPIKLGTDESSKRNHIVACQNSQEDPRCNEKLGNEINYLYDDRSAKSSQSKSEASLDVEKTARNNQSLELGEFPGRNKPENESRDTDASRGKERKMAEEARRGTNDDDYEDEDEEYEKVEVVVGKRNVTVKMYLR